MVVVVDGLAASGGYIAAIASDHIIAQQSSLVGSIGVLFQYPNVTDLLKTVGVKVEDDQVLPAQGGAQRRSSPRAPEARAAIESLVKDSYAWFRDMVAERRKLADAALEIGSPTGGFSPAARVSSSSSSTRSATSRRAREWLAKEKNIDIKTPVRDYPLSRYPRFGDLPFIHVAAVGLLDAVGLTSFARRLEDWGTVQAIERLNLDGLLALWHPPVTN